MSLPCFVNRKSLIVNRFKTPVNCQLSTVNSSKGFSLIEVLVVIAIIGILVSFGSISWTNAQQKGRDGRRKSDLKAVQQALELFYQQNGNYPTQASGGQIRCTPTSPGIAWGDELTCGTNTFIKTLPRDPINNSPNIYCYESGIAYPNFTYSLNANLENTTDPERLSTAVTCNGANYNYRVLNP